MTKSNKTLHFSIVSIFPEMFPGTLGGGVVGRALRDGVWSYDTFNPRDFADDAHRTIDDAAFGGMDGQVMMPDPLARTIDHILAQHPTPPKIIYFSPRGKKLTQAMARSFILHPDRHPGEGRGFILLCGRYEGIDQRLIDEYEIEEISIGDYILSGGELAAQVFIDSIVRLCNNVIRGGSAATESESFEIGGLEWPLYTRPHEWRGRSVPEVLVSGHHENIKEWRKNQSDEITKERRPDLIKKKQK